MKEISPKLTEEILIQNNSRKTWKENDSNENLEKFITEEYGELEKAVELALLGESAFIVASELGDVFYLYAKRMALSPAPVPPDILELIESAYEIADTAGFDPEECARMKLMRNDMKYLHNFFNNGFEYEKGKNISKKQWNIMGGDEAFSRVYEEIIDDF